MSGPELLEDVVRRLGAAAEVNVPLAPRTTYRVGGAAAVWLTVDTEDQIALLRTVVAETGVEVLVVGNGSNLLVADRGFPGLAVGLGGGFAAIEIDGTRIRAGAAAALPVVARRSVGAGLTGFEWAVGVPGSIGGAVCMNAGGHGSDLAAVLAGVRVVDLHSGEDVRVSASALEFGYRRSSIASHDLVVDVDVDLVRGDQRAGAEALAEIVAWRRAHQPGGHNAGSVFTNPPGDSAGRLIDAVGLKGLRIGTAEVSTKHANFIQADPGGRADDVWALLHEVRRRVVEATGVHLEVETRCVGFDAPPHQALDLKSEAEVEG